MTTKEALDKFLESYKAYYNVETENCLEPFNATATFSIHNEQYMLVKVAKYADINSFEYVYFYTAETIGSEEVKDLSDKAWDDGIGKVSPDTTHRNSDITLILICDRIDDDTAKTIKSIRISTLEQLINEIDKENNNIVIECPIDLDENILYIASGVVITGDDSAVLYNGTIRGDSEENVKLKSITFWGCPVTFFNDCKSVNISYCTFSGDENGTQSMLYILKGLGIEIAYCEFIGEDEVQTPLVLIGDRNIIASECQVQIHHCSFLGNASFQSKAAMIHLYNSSFNYLEDDKARFMLAPGTASQYMIENCSFYCDDNPDRKSTRLNSSHT